LSRLVVPTGTKGYAGILSRLEPPTGTKGSHFVPVGVSNRDKRPPSPPLARLAVGPGTKATYCPGPKGCRDKWPGTKACFVVVGTTLWPWLKLRVQNKLMGLFASLQVLRLNAHRNMIPEYMLCLFCSTFSNTSFFLSTRSQ